MADGGTITAADTGPPPEVDPVTGEPQPQGFREWFKSHEMVSLLIGAAILVLTAVLVFRRNQQNSSGTQATGPASSGLSGQTSDTSGQQLDNSGVIANQLAYISAQLGRLTSQGAATPGTPAPMSMTYGPVAPYIGPGSTYVQQLGIGPPARQILPMSAARGGTGEANDYPTVAQWTPDQASIQQTYSNITNGEANSMTRSETALGKLQSDPGPFPPLVVPQPSSAWRPLPVGVPFSAPVSPAGVGGGAP